MKNPKGGPFTIPKPHNMFFGTSFFGKPKLTQSRPQIRQIVSLHGKTLYENEIGGLRQKPYFFLFLSFCITLKFNIVSKNTFSLQV